MKKENRKMAQQRRAEERRKKEIRRKVSKILAVCIPILVIGSGSYIDDFEDQLIGAHPGDTVEVNVTFPDPYSLNTDLSGAEAVFTVTINGIYE